MNSQNIDKKPQVMKETKNKIKVDFERTPLLERLKAKFISMSFVTNITWYIFRLVLMIGIAYIVLFPFYTKIAGSIMPPEDFVNVTVRLIPTRPNLNIYKAIFLELDYMKAFATTLALSASTALIQTFVCCFIAYGLAKFKFKGNKFIFLLVVLTMVVPQKERQFGLDEFPTEAELIARFKQESGITHTQETIIEQPYYSSQTTYPPRYYQRIAINRTVDAIAKGQDRLLLVMATGTVPQPPQ